MHVYYLTMRTTIEIPDSLHLRLIEEASRTGQRGFSRIVERAIKLYFRKGKESTSRKQLIDNLYGSMLEDSTSDRSDIRQNWRTGRNALGEMSADNS